MGAAGIGLLGIGGTDEYGLRRQPGVVEAIGHLAGLEEAEVGIDMSVPPFVWSSTN
jgi:hypothetical protein